MLSAVNKILPLAINSKIGGDSTSITNPVGKSNVYHIMYFIKSLKLINLVYV